MKYFEFFKEHGLVNENGDLLCTIMPRLNFETKRDRAIYNLFYSEAEVRNNQELEIGQLVVNVSQLARDVGMTLDKANYSINRLEELGYITVETLPQNKGKLITIVNYLDYHKVGWEQLNLANTES
ncbi:winged helix-turn-helix domain-containing protein [Bacillus inaquosorum]|uniref:winged helix-turn-helix domain-containing protein n=1 Tax=Bacillus subtilis group TaxID=653685 RepID=UPI002282FC92|nr:MULTISPECIES: winged helix-turn-helix domain-containing protein [Bacillus subtilis group]MCY7785312.1 winged helix-turn-helix domain-containing protein [Bacillus inaquosorum]MCY8251588.1 winged helix-turn-helix domain-containing protein [Bacillus inaquosorum]MCY9296149.1 winged helix-turn-helix domain-containing protein [Bacillus inaquosorum]MDQ4709366.1 winged helix-turn-helix domain-containing protein [Bacillus subtilis]MEC1662965.1 winged helix-turn-helix domain-containing protein [Bacil